MGPDLAPFELVPFFEPNPNTSARLTERGACCLYQPMSRTRHFYILQDVKGLAAQYGYNVKWPVDGPTPNWEVPHLAYLAARNAGHGRSVFWAIYAARWEEGRDICDPATMVEIEKNHGLKDLLSTAAEVEEIRMQGVDAIEQGHDDSAFGVPFFVIGREKFWGQDRLDFVLKKMEALYAS